MKISQSLLKDWIGWQNREVCGSEIKAKYIDKTWDRSWNDSEAKAVGRYFEFLLTGKGPTGYDALPEAQYMASHLKKWGLTNTEANKQNMPVESMYDKYREAHAKAEYVKELMKRSEIEIQRAQVYLSIDGREGNIDIEALYKGEEINIDVKYSGLIDDKWNKFGWRWTEEQTRYNGIQAAHYKSLNGRDFYFLVVDSGKSQDVRFFRADISPVQEQAHLRLVDETRKAITFLNDMDDITNWPSLKKCMECPLKDVCKDAATKLIVEPVDIVL